MFSFEDMRIRYSRSPRLRGLKREFREEWEKRDIPPKPRTKGVWRLADEGKSWKDISGNAADIPDMIVPVKWTLPLRVSRACHDKAVQVTEVEEKEKEDWEIPQDLEYCILSLYPTLPPTTAVLYRHPPLGDPLIPVILSPLRTSHAGVSAVSSTTGLQTQSSATGQSHSSAIGLPIKSGKSGFQSHSSAAQSLSSSYKFQSQSSFTGLPAVSCTFGLQSHACTTGLPDVFSISNPQSHCGTTDFLTELSVTDTPGEPGTKDLPSDSCNYTAEGLRIPRIEQSLRCHLPVHIETRSLEQSTHTSVERKMEELPRHPSTQNLSTNVKALDEVPTSEHSAQCSSTGHFETNPASEERATEFPSAYVTKPEEGPSTSQPQGKRVQEEVYMSPKRYLNTHHIPSVKCVQTSIITEAHDETPSEELPSTATKRSSRMIKVPRRMDL